MKQSIAGGEEVVDTTNVMLSRRLCCQEINHKEALFMYFI